MKVMVEWFAELMLDFVIDVVVDSILSLIIGELRRIITNARCSPASAFPMWLLRNS
jgi:hypothetical protein